MVGLLPTTKHAGGRPRLWKSPEELQQKIDAYIERCNKTDKVFTISGLALALDCDRKTLLNYSHRDEFFPTIKRAKTYAEHCLELLLLTQEDPRGAIFALKFNYGWKTNPVKPDSHSLDWSKFIDQIQERSKLES